MTWCLQAKVLHKLCLFLFVCTLDLAVGTSVWAGLNGIDGASVVVLSQDASSGLDLMCLDGQAFLSSIDEILVGMLKCACGVAEELSACTVMM